MNLKIIPLALLAVLVVSGCTNYQNTNAEDLNQDNTTHLAENPQECEECPVCEESRWHDLYDMKTTKYDELEDACIEEMAKKDDKIERLERINERSKLYNFNNPQIDIGQDLIIRENEITIKFDRKIYLINHESSQIFFLCTDSMKAKFDCEDVVVMYKPTSADEIHVGDIILFKVHGKSGYESVMHEVIKRGRDFNGVYFTTMGVSNLESADFEEKIYFRDIMLKYIMTIHDKGRGYPKEE